jgi:hypothetical protein
MALRAAVTVESGAEAGSGFTGDPAGNGIHFLKTQLGLIEEGLLIRV